MSFHLPYSSYGLDGNKYHLLGIGATVQAYLYMPVDSDEIRVVVITDDPLRYEYYSELGIDVGNFATMTYNGEDALHIFTMPYMLCGEVIDLMSEDKFFAIRKDLKVGFDAMQHNQDFTSDYAIVEDTLNAAYTAGYHIYDVFIDMVYRNFGTIGGHTYLFDVFHLRQIEDRLPSNYYDEVEVANYLNTTYLDKLSKERTIA